MLGEGSWVRVQDGVATPIDSGPSKAVPAPGVSPIGGGYEATGYGDYTVTQKDSGTQRRVRSRVLPAVSSDGSFLASVSDEQGLVLTDLSSSSIVADIDVAGDRVDNGANAFSADRSVLAFEQWDPNGNSIVTLVSLEPTVWVEAACMSAMGPLSPSELERFVPGSPLEISTCPSR